MRWLRPVAPLLLVAACLFACIVACRGSRREWYKATCNVEWCHCCAAKYGRKHCRTACHDCGGTFLSNHGSQLSKSECTKAKPKPKPGKPQPKPKPGGGDGGGGGGGKNVLANYHFYDTWPDLQSSGAYCRPNCEGCPAKVRPGAERKYKWVAVNPASIGRTMEDACGRTMTVKGDAGTATVLIVDQKGGEGIDLAQPAFDTVCGDAGFAAGKCYPKVTVGKKA